MKIIRALLAVLLLAGALGLSGGSVGAADRIDTGDETIYDPTQPPEDL